VVILTVGDVVGASGMETLRRQLGPLRRFKSADVVIVNGENTAVMGMSPDHAARLFEAGADVVTLGNHTWGRRELIKAIDDMPYVLRPYNFAPQTPGRGLCVFETSKGKRVGVVSLIGRCEMSFIPDNPFYAADRALAELKGRTDTVVFDMHAEATSEKLALAWYLDGRAGVVFGTHTHVPTADARVFPKGTGYITDLGMTGPYYSVLGIKPEQSVSYFLGNVPERYEAAPGPCVLSGALFEMDDRTGLCVNAERIELK
jgi:2',3'-cyclic-nucleotide 2'-phosphodiesterase